MSELLLTIPHMPFYIGPTSSNSHGSVFPDTLPFNLSFDFDYGLVRQVKSSTVQKALHAAYNQGSLIGTAMDSEGIGQKYAHDFLSFCEASVDIDKFGSSPSALEIGPGRGYLLHLLNNKGWQTIGIEPGRRNEAYWKKHGVTVTCDFFPSPQIHDTYDFIIAHGVLEHIDNPIAFITSMKKHLHAGSFLFLAVPNAEPDLLDGNISCLTHEHFNYFTSRSLSNILTKAGLQPTAIKPAGFGGGLYCAAAQIQRHTESSIDPSYEYSLAKTFCQKAEVMRKAFTAILSDAERKKRVVGFFVPFRIINILEQRFGFRWFDDDSELTGKFIPPFLPAIENRTALHTHPVDEMYIMSRTFGRSIKESFLNEGVVDPQSIHCIDDIIRFNND
jgi:2-polyprenyl-3-methyl-5-hydroxy-6-metoxy-1,4-benzoquinol methylase